MQIYIHKYKVHSSMLLYVSQMVSSGEILKIMDFFFVLIGFSP